MFTTDISLAIGLIPDPPPTPHPFPDKTAIISRQGINFTQFLYI
ncbi:hypothetical protein [Laspinema olomoucense]|nr:MULTISPECIES: hypothetical protein [unclassified Laspinema]